MLNILGDRFYFVFFILLGFFLKISPSHARVFSFTDSWVAGYIKGTGGMSLLGSSAYKDTSGTSTDFRNRDSIDYNFSGEFGFVFLIKPEWELQMGLEGIQSKDAAIKGYLNSSSAEFMKVDSSVAIFNPVIRLSYLFKTFASSRLSFYGGAGYSNVRVTNEYTLTSTPYGGNSEFKESWYTNALSYDSGFAWEFFVFDNATMLLSAGWRFIDASDFKISADTTGIRGNTSVSLSKGQSVRNNGGNKVTLDMGGPYAGISFRFYIPPLD